MTSPVRHTQALPAGPFGCILADPPWAFRTFSGDAVPQRADEQHYDTMALDALMALPVREVAARDCLLIVWCVGAMLPQALALGEAWGFRFVSDGLWWLKQRLRDADQIDLFTDDISEPVKGMGYWFRKQGELSLVFSRGNPKRCDAGVPGVIIEPRREHSRKPDCQYERIEALVEGPYLELFARQAWPGWSAWGNQVGKFEPVLDQRSDSDEKNAA